jgi:AcrR family transcriptional regulator
MEKRQQLVEAALTLFYQHSVHATGINDVLALAGVARKTLYHHFDSKEALLLAALELRDQRWCDWLHQRLASASSLNDLIKQLFDTLDDWFNERELAPFYGCFFQQCASEYSQSDSDVWQYCHQHQQRVLTLLQQHLQRVSSEPDAQSQEQVQAIGLKLLLDGAIAQAQTGNRNAALDAKKLALTALI